jgi:polysaccharide chain length determinant protein (PEP-CTERM system associated)
MAERAPKVALTDLVRGVWRRRKWLALAAFIPPLVIGVSVVLFMPSLYRAAATVLVDRQQVPETLVAPTVTTALETRLQTISQEILGRSRLEALIARFNLYPELRKQISAEELLDRMRSDIRLDVKGVDIKGGREATVAFTLSYLGSRPETVAEVANTLVSFYIEENANIRERQASGTAEFLRVQLDGTKKRLDEQEREVSDFKRRHLGELPQQMEANLAALERLQMQLRVNADSQARAEERRRFVAAQLDEAGSTTAAGSPEVPPTRLARLRQELTELRARYSDRYPDVIQTEAEIARITREMAESKSRGAPPAETAVVLSPYALRLRQALTEADAELKLLRSEGARLRAEIGSYQQRVEKVPQREQEFRELARDYETTREFYQSLLKRHEEAQVAESMERRQKGEQFRILEPAVPPKRPVASRTRLMLVALAASAALAAAVAYVAEQLDTSFHTPEELTRYTAARLLISVPPIVTDTDVTRRRLRFCMAGAAACVGVVALVAASYLVAHGNEYLVWLIARRTS